MRNADLSAESVEQALHEDGRNCSSTSLPNPLSVLKDNRPYNLRERTSALTPAEKDRIREKAGYRCWLCGFYGNEVAHLIAKEDIVLFKDYRDRGFHKMHSIHSPENLVCLCGTCHNSYDKTTPTWIFIPINLAEFLEDEEQFQADRIAAAEKGQDLRRKPSVVNTFQNKYARYQTREGFISTETFRKNPVKELKCNPFAAIIHSARINGSVERVHPRLGGIPKDVAATFSKLIEHYTTLAPEVPEKSKVTENPKVTEKPKVAGKSKVTGERKVTGRSKVTGRPKATAKSKVTTKSNGFVQTRAQVPVIELLKGGGRSSKRRIQDITGDDDESTFGGSSNHTNQTAHSYDTRLSRAVQPFRQELASIAETSVTGTEVEVPSDVWFRADKRRKSKADVGKWVEGSGRARTGLTIWLVQPEE